MANKRLKIGTRGSRLALIQAQRVAQRLESAWEGLEVTVETIRSEGDLDQTTPVELLGGEGLFTRALDQALARRRIDCAVHSAKDLPTRLFPGTVIAAIPERISPLDAFISRDGLPLSNLPAGSVVAAGSHRRRAFLKRMRPDIELAGIRGNIETRIEKIGRLEADGLVVAHAALLRLGISPIEVFGPDRMMPAAAQGAIAVTARADDREMLRLLGGLSDLWAALTVLAERTVLAGLGADCHTPIGVLGEISGGGGLELAASLCSADGKTLLRDVISGAAKDAEKLGRELARRLLERDARVMLKMK